MPIRVVSTRDQQPLTVNTLVEYPLIIQERILDLLPNQFVMDRVLRNGGTATGGAVQFRVSSGLFTDDDVEIVNEFAEIPLSTATRGDIQTEAVRKRALGIAISREMRIRNAMGEVDRQLMVLRNTMVRAIDGVFLTKLRGAVTQTVAASFPWANSSATIRRNINAARLLVAQSQTPGSTLGNAFMGFMADTLLINPQSESDLLNSSEFLTLLQGQINPTNIGTLADGNALGLRVMVSQSVLPGEAWVLQSKMVGGYADEIPLEVTELYEWRPNQSWRADVTRSTAAFIDQPLAAARITGV